jgi:glycosyltransferase involved in cell wall biosynthesis
MRILHFIHSANPVGGGPIEGIRQLAGAHLPAGHEVELLCLDAPAAPWLSGFPFPVHAMGPGRSSYGYSPRAIPWLRQHHGNYDIVIVNGLWQFNGYATRRALRGTRTPYCVFTHGMLDPWFKRRYPLKHLKKWLYWPWGEYRVLRDAAAVFFTAEEERLQARKSFWLYRCRERLVGYGTAGPTGDPDAQRAVFAETFPALAGRRFLLFLGRVHEKKGCEILLEAFALARNGHDIQLVFAGPADGPYADHLRAEIARRGLDRHVTWTGMLGGDLKWGAFRCAEAFILPSHQENFGIAVAEALACGLPVLISDKVNIFREIAADRAGLVETDDLHGTCRLIQRWFALPAEERETMRSRAAASFARRFDIHRAAAELISELTRVIEHRDPQNT